MPMLCNWGHSVGLRIPKAVLESAHLAAGDECICRTLDNGTILITPIKKRPGAAVPVGGKAAGSPAKETVDKW